VAAQAQNVVLLFHQEELEMILQLHLLKEIQDTEAQAVMPVVEVELVLLAEITLEEQEKQQVLQDRQ
jgi:hypothetical protein